MNKGFQPLVEALSSIPKPGKSGWGRRGLLPTNEGVRGVGQLLSEGGV
jgi:hypothetical protein